MLLSILIASSVTLVEAWSLDPDYPIGTPRGAAHSSATDHLYLWDRHQPVVHVFDIVNGEPLFTFGTPGAGPGDIDGYVEDVAAFDDGRIGVVGTHSGLAVYDSTGRFVEHWLDNTPTDAARRIWTAGEHLLAGRNVVETFTPRTVQLTSLARWSPAGVWGPPLAEHRWSYGPGVNRPVERDMGRGLGWDIGRDGRVYLARAWDRYEIEVVDTLGRVERWIDSTAAPVPRTDAELDRLAERRNMEPGCERCPGFTWELEPNRPAIQMLRVGDDGALWVLPARGAVETGGQTWDTWVEGTRGERTRYAFPVDPRFDRAIWLGDDRVLLLDDVEEDAPGPLRIRLFVTSRR